MAQEERFTDSYSNWFALFKMELRCDGYVFSRDILQAVPL